MFHSDAGAIRMRRMEETKTFTVSEARAALPHLRSLLAELQGERTALLRLHPQINRARARAEQNGGSPYGELYLTHAFAFATVLESIEETGAIIKDFNAGLVDFPHEHEGRIVYLCWKLGEDDLAWWHEIEDGFAGRQPIEETFERSN
jgi:hypothetical protein